MKVMMLRCRWPADPDLEDRTPCGKVAKVLILADSGRTIEALPVCADHAPEVAHETASSMDTSEFLIVELPAFGVGDLT